MKYRVHLREVIGDYGQDEWHEDYDTEQAAYARIAEVNSKPNLGTGWYIQTRDKVEKIADIGKKV